MLNKIYTTILSLSFLLLGKYDANSPSFKDVSYYSKGNNVIIDCILENAFENDFDKIFASGKQIDVWFIVKIMKDKKQHYKRKFKHSVTFDPLSQEYTVFFEEGQESLIIKNYDELKAVLSNIHLILQIPKSGIYQFKIESFLDKINIKGKDNEFNLMALWKFKRPSFSSKINLQQEG